MNLFLMDFMLICATFNFLGYNPQNYFTLMFSLQTLEVGDLDLHSLLEFSKTFDSSIKSKFSKSSF